MKLAWINYFHNNNNNNNNNKRESFIAHIYIYTLQQLPQPREALQFFAYNPGASWTIQHIFRANFLRYNKLQINNERILNMHFDCVEFHP